MLLLWSNIVSMLEGHMLEQRQLEIRSLSTQFATTLSTGNYIGDVTARPIPNQEMLGASRSRDVRIIVVDEMATVLFDSSMGAEVGSTWATPGIMQALDGSHHYFISDDLDTLLEIAPILAEGGGIAGAVMMSQSAIDDRVLIETINDLTVNFIVLLGLIVAALVLLIAGWFIGPMKRILSSMSKISDGHLEERINLKGKDEFSFLGLAINDMTDKLSKVETARQEFVSNVSHELKTPLSSIKVLSESLLLQEDVESEVYREFFTDVTAEVDRMTNIVNELLTLVRMDEVELPLNISNFNLNKMLEEVIKRLKPLASEREIEVEFAPLRQVSLDADEMKISLAISNLVENAIKYNNAGGLVKIILDADNKSAFITVADTGVGISEENQTKVYSRFFRVDKGRDRETGGTGLGLAITHKTILLHKGSIKLTSKEEEGSTFVVRIPIHSRS